MRVICSSQWRVQNLPLGHAVSKASEDSCLPPAMRDASRSFAQAFSRSGAARRETEVSFLPALTRIVPRYLVCFLENVPKLGQNASAQSIRIRKLLTSWLPVSCNPQSAEAKPGTLIWNLACENCAKTLPYESARHRTEKL